MTKQQIIASMLNSYYEARETLNGPTDIPGDGENRYPKMPKTWTPEYQQLHELLKQLRANNRADYAHLHARYLETNPYNEIVRKVSINDRGNIILPNHTQLLTEIDRSKHVATVRLRRWHPWVRRERINNCLDWLAENYKGEPALAPELRDRYPLAA